MSLKTAYSTKPASEAVAELKSQCDGRPKVVLFFASAKYDFETLGKKMNEAFLGSVVLGCSTAGELVDGKMLTESLVAVFMGGDLIEDAACALIENLNSEVLLPRAFQRMETKLKRKLNEMDFDKTVGLVIADGLSGAEERLIQRIRDFTDLQFVGASAGDDLHFHKTFVCGEGRAASNAAVLLMLRLKKSFEIVKTQSFRSMGRVLTATKVNSAERSVVEFDNRSALKAYAEALGVCEEDAPNHFFGQPLGLMIDGELLVRSPKRTANGVMYFYCQIKEGQQLDILQPTDIVADMRSVLESKREEFGSIEGLLHFQCVLRTLQLRNENKCERYGELFSGIPTAGFSAYGETYLGHLTQTSAMLVFH